MRFDPNEMPNLQGKLAIVTGANSGTGFEITKAMASAGSKLIMACRSEERGNKAREKILDELPKAELELLILDLGSFNSIQKFAETILEKYDQLDYLFNNAGVMDQPYGTTEDGFELHFGINHLGHFALTGQLLPLLLSSSSRIITMSSFMHRFGSIKLDDLNSEKKYRKVKAYSQSKLANLLFAFDLGRKLKRYGYKTMSIGTHPGWAATNLQFAGNQKGSKLRYWAYKIANPIFAQSPRKGALPALFAAVDEQIQSGDYTGSRFMVWGSPKIAKPSKKTKDKTIAERLWKKSEELTGISYQF